jgi:hypothetical protein
MAFEVHRRPLAELARFYRTFGERQAPMVALVEALAASGRAADLHSGTTKATLVLARTSTFDVDAGVLRVSYDGVHIVLAAAEAPRPTRPWVRRVSPDEGYAAVEEFLIARRWSVESRPPVG